jgi:hypothetical protein
VELVFYSPVSGNAEERLQKVIQSTIPEWKGTIVRTVDDLWQQLLLPKNDLAIALLLPWNRDDIEGLLPKSHLFRNTRIILIAPDRDKETIVAAHLLRPRLLTYRDGDFVDVFTVLSKIIADYHNHTGMEGR